ncbi:hypothetical protein G6F31_013989 [Rhizopus arrhizus]|nr:hypothetical protein G6F31_013989 [Rhizopus arrhizus]
MRGVGALFRGHADGAVQADGLAVQHIVRDDAVDQLGIVFRTTQARGERDAGGQRILHFLGHAENHRRAEDARGDGHAADAGLGQIARDRQGHAGHAGLRCGIGGLADLAVKRGDRGGVDHHAAFAGGLGRIGAHGFGGQAHHVDAADQVDRHVLLEQVQRMRAVLAHDLGGGRHTRAVHQAEEGAQFKRRGDGALAVGFLRPVAMPVALAKVLRQGLAGLVLHGGDDDLGAVFHQHAHGACTQAGRAARNEEYLGRDCHVSTTRSVQGDECGAAGAECDKAFGPGRERIASGRRRRPVGHQCANQLLTASKRRDLISSTAPTPEILRYFGASAAFCCAQVE